MILFETVSCDLCGSKETDEILAQKDLAYLMNEELFHVVECRRCHLRYTNPRPVKEHISKYYFDEYYALVPDVLPIPEKDEPVIHKWSQNIRKSLKEEFYGYPKHQNNPKNRIILSMKKAFLRVEQFRLIISGREKGIIPYRGEGRILDIGCGNGAILNGLKHDRWKTYGVEFNPGAVRFAKENLKLDVFLGDLFDAKYPDIFFDVILFNHTLEHMYSPGEVLKETNRILKEDGLLMISLPNSKSFEAVIFKSYWFPWELPRHLYHFSIDTLSKVLNQNGFKVKKIMGETGIGTFFQSLDYLYRFRFQKSVRFRSLIKILIRPLLFFIGHLGYSGTITIHAQKKRFRR